MKRFVTLISGRGSNLEALINRARKEGWPVEHSCVISNAAAAQGLAVARAAGLQTRVIDHRQYATRELFDAELGALLDDLAPDVIALAGFMRILSSSFCRRFEGRLLNIHPSLLPAFAGLRTHERALESGVKFHGCTAHAVTAELDHGPILAQGVVPVLPGDDAIRLADRVLELEHEIYPSAVAAVLSGRCRWSDGRWQEARPDFPHRFEPCLVHPLLRQD